MVPIYDTDLAEERWAKNKWDQYELWEKVEARRIRKRKNWIILAVVIFLILSSVPVIADRSKKWITYSAVRKLGQAVNSIKREAALSQKAVRIRFSSPGFLKYVIETADRCDSKSWQELRSNELFQGPQSSEYTVMTREQGQAMEVPGLAESLCYDPFRGLYMSSSSSSEKAVPEDNPSAFAVISVKDLTESRMDRLSILMISKDSAETSFE